jgi:hypothetical protein
MLKAQAATLAPGHFARSNKRMLAFGHFLTSALSQRAFRKVR